MSERRQAPVYNYITLYSFPTREVKTVCFILTLFLTIVSWTQIFVRVDRHGFRDGLHVLFQFFSFLVVSQVIVFYVRLFRA